jgi:choline dehydrogenase-like flavoprotein
VASRLGGTLIVEANLITWSSSAFPTSSQTNPTLTILTFAVRIARYLTQNLQAL